MNKFLSYDGLKYALEQLLKKVNKIVSDAIAGLSTVYAPIATSTKLDQAVAGLTVDGSNGVKSYVDGLNDARLNGLVNGKDGAAAKTAIAKLFENLDGTKSIKSLVDEAAAGDIKPLAIKRVGKEQLNSDDANARKQVVATALGVDVSKVTEAPAKDTSYVAHAYGKALDDAGVVVALVIDADVAASTALDRGDINKILTGLDSSLYPAGTTEGKYNPDGTGFENKQPHEA